MNWIKYPEIKPTKSQPYLISITRPYSGGDLTFNYIAFYDAESNQWFKYDGFSNENNVLEKITEKINGWADDLTTYLG